MIMSCLALLYLEEYRKNTALPARDNVPGVGLLFKHNMSPNIDSLVVVELMTLQNSLKGNELALGLISTVLGVSRATRSSGPWRQGTRAHA